MGLDIYFINGMMLGIEYVPYQEEEGFRALVIDLFIIRFTFLW